MARRFDRIAYRDVTELAAQAIANLAQLQFVGISERIGRDLPRLFRDLDLQMSPEVTRQNASSSGRQVDIRDPAIRQLLKRFVGADLQLYRHVVRRRGLWSYLGQRMSGGSSRVYTNRRRD